PVVAKRLLRVLFLRHQLAGISRNRLPAGVALVQRPTAPFRGLTRIATHELPPWWDIRTTDGKRRGFGNAMGRRGQGQGRRPSVPLVRRGRSVPGRQQRRPHGEVRRSTLLAALDPFG